MTAEQTAAPEAEKWALILRKPGTGLSLTVYRYVSEAAARADIAVWQKREAYAGYLEAVVLPEALVQALVEREGQG
jgi:hypothetical protein